MNGLKRWTVRHAGLLLLWVSFPVGPLSALGLSVGDRVQTTGGVVVYQMPGAGKLGTQATGSLGVAVSGPQIATLSGVIYLWWNISFDLGSSGWVQQDFLTSIVPSAPVLALTVALTA